MPWESFGPTATIACYTPARHRRSGENNFSIATFGRSSGPNGAVKTARHLDGHARIEGRVMSHTAFRCRFLIQAFLQADLLKNDAYLMSLIEDAMRMLLPPDVLGPFLDLLREAGAKALPHKATISRWRLIVDGGYMNLQREMVAESIADGGCVSMLMADSSTQHKNEFEHVVARSIPRRIIVSLTQHADELIELRQGTDFEDDDALFREKSLGWEE